MATVEPVKRPASKVASAKLTALKKAFVIYIKNDAEFRKSVTYPDFKAERVMAIRSAEGLTHYLIHHLHMPTADRIKLLTLSDAKRVDRLGKLLDEANRHAQGAGVNHI